MSCSTILHAIETGGPGGAETVCLNLASRVDPQRFRSLVMLPDDRWLNQELRARGVPTFLSGARRQGTRRHLAELARLVRDEKVDLIHSHLPDENFYASLVGRRTGRKVVVTYHGALWGGWKAKLKLALVKRTAAAVVGVSGHMVSELKRAGFPAEKVSCIYNGVDVERFEPAGNGSLRQELGCGQSSRLVGMVANLRGSKRYEDFVQAARHIAERAGDVHFVAVGEPEAGIAARLQQAIRDLALDGRFHLLGFRQDVPQILNQLDVFVLTSGSEGFSLATIEAMAARRPVVVTRSGGPEEIVKDGETGMLVPPGEPEAMAARVCELLQAPQRAAELGSRGRASVEQRFSLAAMVRQYEQLYQRCLEA